MKQMTYTQLCQGATGIWNNLAGLYLDIDSKRPGFLTWFGLGKGSFLVALGADGAPFGKHNEAISWLLAF